jgi:hypothetical protein
VLALGAYGWRSQDRLNETRYQHFDPVADWLHHNAPAGHRVGLAGLWAGGPSPAFPAFGPRLENRVVYVGPFVREVLREYGDRERFVAALRSGRYDLLVVGRGAGDRLLPAAEVEEERWAKSIGYREVARSSMLTAYRAPAPGPPAKTGQGSRGRR